MPLKTPTPWRHFTSSGPASRGLDRRCGPPRGPSGAPISGPVAHWAGSGHHLRGGARGTNVPSTPGQQGERRGRTRRSGTGWAGEEDGSEKKDEDSGTGAGAASSLGERGGSSHFLPYVHGRFGGQRVHLKGVPSSLPGAEEIDWAWLGPKCPKHLSSTGRP